MRFFLAAAAAMVLAAPASAAEFVFVYNAPLVLDTPGSGRINTTFESPLTLSAGDSVELIYNLDQPFALSPKFLIRAGAFLSVSVPSQSDAFVLIEQQLAGFLGGADAAVEQIVNAKSRFFIGPNDLFGGRTPDLADLSVSSARAKFTYQGGLPIQIIGADFFLASVPEPASWALMVSGFGVVGATLRRRPLKTGYAG